MRTAPVAPVADTASTDTNCPSAAVFKDAEVAVRMIASVPPPPVTVSLPAKPTKLSFPEPPVKVSAKAPPVIEKPSV